MAIVFSAVVYLSFMSVVGVATGILMSVSQRRPPSQRDMLIDFAVAGTGAIVSAFVLSVYNEVRGITISDPPSLIPMAVGAVVVRHVVGVLRRGK